MYPLDINFLKERQEEPKPQRQTQTVTTEEATGSLEEMLPLIVGAAIGLILPLGVAGYWYWLSSQTASNEETINNVKSKVEQLDQNKKSIKQQRQSQKATLERAEENLNALASVFTQIQPVSAILEEIRTSAPDNVQVNAIQQSRSESEDGGSGSESENGESGTITFQLEGVAGSYEDVNLLFLRLKRSPFVKADSVNIETANQSEANIQIEDSPGNLEGIAPRNVISYTLDFELTDQSAVELIPALQENEAVGLVARIRALQQAGILEE